MEKEDDVSTSPPPSNPHGYISTKGQKAWQEGATVRCGLGARGEVSPEEVDPQRVTGWN